MNVASGTAAAHIGRLCRLLWLMASPDVPSWTFSRNTVAKALSRHLQIFMLPELYIDLLVE